MNGTIVKTLDNKKLPAAILIFCVFLYILFRLWHLTDSCLWFDEIFSVHAAEMDWRNMISFVAQDLIHPPLFYILLKIWIAAGGDGLWWLRFFPVLFSIIAVAPFYLICREIKLQIWTICFALSFFAVNGALVKYAQEVRMYSLLLCFSLFSLWIFLRFIESGKKISLLTFINILLIYTHYFGWLLILSEIIAVLMCKRTEIKRISASFLICLLSFTPWIYAIWSQAETNSDISQNLGWAVKPNFSVIFQFVLDLFEPFYFQASSIDYASDYLISIPMLSILIAVFVLFLISKTSGGKTFNLFSVIILTPIFAAFLLSWMLPYSIWGTRHLIIVFAPFSILTALAIEKIEIKSIKISLAAVFGVLILISFIIETRRENQKFIWCGWESLARNLDKNQPQTVYVFEDLVAYHFWFAVRDTNNIQVVRVKNVPEMIEDKAYFLPRGFQNVQTINVDEIKGDKFYIAFRDLKFDERHPPLNILREKGYKISQPQIYDAYGLKAYLVEVEKSSP